VFAEPTSLSTFRMTPKAVSVIERALAMVPEAFSTSGVTNL
jgi:hypothetical protein